VVIAFALTIATMGPIAVDLYGQQQTVFPTPPAADSMDAPPAVEQLDELKQALVRLPLAAALAAVLAMRPKRRSTPQRSPAVIQTQIILAVIGALVMLVVGSSLARAFGIVGAAGLVRYRARVDDPKDAGVMLSTLGVGLASGVGMWMLAIFGTVFILLLLGVVESFEPIAMRRVTLRIKAKDPASFKPRVETLLRRLKADFEIRQMTPEELHYEVSWPVVQSTDQLSERIMAMEPSPDTEVEIAELKPKKV
jgi:uncharacterized membrane protein YhiD involved in acid resistance